VSPNAKVVVDAVDACEVLVLVDNVSDLLSSIPASSTGEITGEIPNVMAAGAKRLSGRCLCCAQWGLALLIDVWRDGKRRRLLFDAGPEGYGVERNADRLGLDFGSIEAIVLSHGHWDHAGGLETALRHTVSANGGRPVPVHVNDGMFVQRGVPSPDGRGVLPFDEVPSKAVLAGAGAELVSDPMPRMLLDGGVFLSGDIPRVTPYELGMPSQLAQDVNGQWVPDPLVSDERWVAVVVAGLGAIVFTACSHAGVINVLIHARQALAPTPLHAVMGGLHLSGAGSEPLIADTVRDLGQFGLRRIVPAHCTGWRATHRLVEAFGESVVVPSAVGRRFRFEATSAT
jgi:7,8-dihydropterin-6-yl-methyl-4-(beta-D-ribofuranosyl)aminobenzene 5'-phosphate synthase